MENKKLEVLCALNLRFRINLRIHERKSHIKYVFSFRKTFTVQVQIGFSKISVACFFFNHFLIFIFSLFASPSSKGRLEINIFKKSFSIYLLFLASDVVFLFLRLPFILVYLGSTFLYSTFLHCVPDFIKPCFSWSSSFLFTSRLQQVYSSLLISSGVHTK